MPSMFDLLLQYTDIIGRCTVYPTNRAAELQGNFDSNNALLYSGELALLLHRSDLYSFSYQTQHNLAWAMCTIKFGNEALITRHPEPYRLKPNMRPLSFDELRGTFMAATVNPQLMPLAKALIRYGENNNWVFTDQPNQEYQGKSLLSLLKTPQETFSQLKAYRARAKEIGLDNGGMRKAAQEFKYLNPMFFWTKPSDRAFYKLCAGQSATMWEKSFFLLSEMIGVFSKDAGSRLMGGFMHMALNNVKHHSMLVKAARLVYHWGSRYHYGKNYMYELADEYFAAPHHPIKVLCYGTEVM
jgi:hypothetical protein